MSLFNFFTPYVTFRLVLLLLFVAYNGDTTLCESISVDTTQDDFETSRRLHEIEVYGRERNSFERNADTIIVVLLIFTVFCTIGGTYLDYVERNGD